MSFLAQKKLEEAVGQGVFPCGVLAVVGRGDVRYASAGLPETFPAMPEHAMFDLASLSKVVATTSLAMLLTDEGRLDIEAPVASYLSDFLDFDKEHEAWRRKVSVRMLLAHCGGFPPWLPFWKRDLESIEAKRRLVRESPLESEPGSVTSYSDIGMMLVGQIIERISGAPLEVFAKDKVFTPLGMTRTCYNPSEAALCVPTEEKADAPGCYWQGVVHDENARWLDGVAGHAGVFSCAEDLSKLCTMLLNGGDGFISRRTFDEFTRKANLVAGSSRSLGWDGWSEGCAGGSKASPDSFGHTGFTGTSLWVDRENDIAVILLTNAVHPHRECKANGYFKCRNEIHTACYC